MAKRGILCLLLALGLTAVQAQDSSFRAELKHLCTAFSGRGYVDSGAWRASDYLANQFAQAGLETFGSTYFQTFPFRVNTFPGKLYLSSSGKQLIPAQDYLVNPKSKGIKGNFPVFVVRLEDLASDSIQKAWEMQDWSKTAILIDTMSFSSEMLEKRYKKITHNSHGAPVLLVRSKRGLIWSVSQEQAAYTLVEIGTDIAIGDSISIDIEAEHVELPQRNVIGYVPGTVHRDSFLVVCAHYDHLGKMGANTTFPGANDNASGTLMMLELARYFSKHPAPFSIVFIAFTAEEAGLVGSRYFVEEDPLVPLKSIRFVMNMDLEGSGSKGITVVNATIYPEEFEIIKKLNGENEYLSKVQRRGKAANSDHYWFSEHDVPAFFIYQMGDYAYYHVPEDDWNVLPLTKFIATKQLVIEFFETLTKQP